MTIDDAIELLTMSIGFALNDKTYRYDEAVKLGIEALKHLRDYREWNPDLALHLLPGEEEK